jgi:hypothetical protein
LDLAITYLHGGQPPSCQKVGSSLRTRLASQADHKNKLSIAPILQIFIFKEMLFFMNPVFALDVFIDKKWPIPQMCCWILQ